MLRNVLSHLPLRLISHLPDSVQEPLLVRRAEILVDNFRDSSLYDRPSDTLDSTRGSGDPTITSEEEAIALDSDALQSQYSITAVTWNAGNSSTPPEAIVKLANAIHPIDQADNAPDIMVICLQEAKKTLMLNEDVAQRIIKRYGNCYEILHTDGLLALTHLKEVRNLTHWSRTHLVVAYKKSRLSAEDIKIEKEGTYTPRSTLNPLENFDNKGGLYLVLNVRGIRVGIVGAHLDSFCTTRRQAQARELRRLCESHEKPLNSLMFMGDLNERLAPEVLADTTSNDQGDKTLQELLGDKTTEQVIAESLTLLQHRDSHLCDLDFLEPTEFTYIKKTTDGKVPSDPRRSRRNLGALDNIGIQNFALWIKRLQHANSKAVTPVRPKDRSDYEVSDHAAIIGKYTLLLPLSNVQKKQFVSFLGKYQIRIFSQRTVEKQTTLLQQLHDQLNDANHPDCFIAYFEYAMSMRQPASENDHSFRYYLKDINLVKKDIIFIVNHLDALENQVISLERYQNLIFGTCSDIGHLRNQGRVMSDIHQRLLRQDTKCPFALRISLLALCNDWLRTNQQYHIETIDELTYSLRDIDTQLNNSHHHDHVLTTFHAWLLNAANSPELVKTYFQHAIERKQPAFQGDRSVPYHLKEIELVKIDISFIVSHLGVLGGQANKVAPYRDLIFGTCEAIEALPGNNGEFMQLIYTQLLNEEIRGVNQLKMALLSPFRQWLDHHEKERERYTLSGNESHFTVKKLGFFAGSAPQGLALTAFERAQLR